MPTGGMAAKAPVRSDDEIRNKLRVISIAPLIAGALERLLADGTLADVSKVNAPNRAADKEKKKHASTTLSVQTLNA